MFKPLFFPNSTTTLPSRGQTTSTGSTNKRVAQSRTKPHPPHVRTLRDPPTLPPSPSTPTLSSCALTARETWLTPQMSRVARDLGTGHLPRHPPKPIVNHREALLTSCPTNLSPSLLRLCHSLRAVVTILT